ncbi:MAG: geranylgeranylglyceryl/heptaprenylglyceryl phosphate synthase [Bacteroidetes bacterium RIFOXYA12_FULL_35_11]|nr:MAG: geranylgeranylglyceryl/heptaprenylglyceryl phosphate synthase [Bacteroidetes bacterium GWF2_35_48]OFY74422.1 MAG: geranylgeranylglyceryl/heptaprenylglyceryl phosphate synthase [Bacteroidetes bacterium RIFOXYA12_FULL_35_11]OFY95922.1 MAG: geranylgeranylglyceryl/heptaprenylglyceryl phosphate synthase [Bacteroidetes bacterium RIFOXYC12_FULL_35_7]HBX50700.1 geranylgeranylglyceryl/heptaprenylglyceryl phosphate synthase [Bacteroidales bacterium]
MIYKKILNNYNKGKKQLALLIDPDKYTSAGLKKTINDANKANVDFILVGGSLMFHNHVNVISHIKSETKIPVILFPGSLLQISPDADAILFLSLISGRNPDFLIGNHVVAAPLLKKSKIEIIPTGYILVEGGRTTSVEYMSNTKPIPGNKIDIAVATALAGEMSGHKLIYIEAGSGAEIPVTSEMMTAVKKNIAIPLIVGGGIRTNDSLKKACKAGADIIVIGTAFETNTSSIETFSKIIHEF